MGKVILMTGILKFNLPEETEEFKAAQNGMALRCELQTFENELRSNLKYEDIEDPEILKLKQYVRERINLILKD